MSQHQEPPRLLDLGGIPPSLAESLRAAGRDGFEEASAARVAAGVAEGIGSAGASGAGSAGASTMVGKVAAGVVGTGILVGGLWLAARSGEPAQSPPEPVTATQSAQPPAVVATGVASAMASGTAKVEAAAATRTMASPADGMSAASSLAEEHRLLRAARSALAGAPARALALTREHERRFPRGVLAQEREVIAIQALAAMGEGEAARKKADGFDEKYPDSPHRRGVGEVVDP